MGSWNRIWKLGAVAMFYAALWLPLMGYLFNLDWSEPLEEKRPLARRPNLPATGVQWRPFPRQFEAWFNDHLGFRSSLIRWHNYVLLDMVRSSPARSDVVLGSDGWHFLWNAHLMEYYRQTHPYTETELEALCALLEERHAWCAARGATFVYAIAPEAVTINGEHMPEWITRLPGPSRLDQLIAYMSTHSSVPVIDLREPVARVKSEYQTHYKLDSHWTDVAALSAWSAVGNALRSRYPDLYVPVWENYTFESKLESPREIPNLIPLPYTLTEPVTRLTPKRADAAWHAGLTPRVWKAGYYNHSSEYTPQVYCSPNRSAPTAVLFGDSFGYAIAPFAAESFSKLVYAMQSFFDPLLVDLERPDVVIWLHSERQLTYLKPDGAEMHVPSAEQVSHAFVLAEGRIDDVPWSLLRNRSFEMWNDSAPPGWTVEGSRVAPTSDAFDGERACSLEDAGDSLVRIRQDVRLPDEFAGGRVELRFACLADSASALHVRFECDGQMIDSHTAAPDGRWHAWYFKEDVDESRRGKQLTVSIERQRGANGRALIDDVYLCVVRPEGLPPGEDRLD